ncbi:MAG: diaminopimelate decarboxylase [Elusimicrobia bacterium]|nr:diaminopimelate decarboxylase [Elusimicrobiota bacterium]
MDAIKKHFNASLIKKIASKFGTPIFVYSEKIILDSIKSYKTAFSKTDILFCYALKANSNNSLCSILAKKGIGADIVSGGELFRALKAGFEPQKIVFSGVGKTEEELNYALKSNVLMINVESFDELEILKKVASKFKKIANFSIRINPDIDPHTHKFITTGKLGGKFGVSLKEAFRMYEYSKKFKFLNPIGMQVHLGSQIYSVKPYVMAIDLILAAIKKLSERGINIKYIDIGGGWGVDEIRGMRPPAILAKAINSKIKHLSGIKLIIEPGRSLMASAGILITKVLYKKKSGDKNFIIVNGAMNDFIRPALYGAKHPVYSFSRNKKKLKADIVGPVCESGDFLAKDIELPLPENGDLLAIGSVGAYGQSMSSQYNSRLRAPEILLKGKSEYKLIRKRESFRDLIYKEVRLP